MHPCSVEQWGFVFVFYFAEKTKKIIHLGNGKNKITIHLNYCKV